MRKNRVVTLEERNEWSGFAELLAGIFAKYADEVNLDELPDPDDFLAEKEMKKQYRTYMRESQKIIHEKESLSIEYVVV